VQLMGRSIRGLEWFAAAEVAERLPAAAGITMASREIAFQLPDLVADLFDLRTVDDVFLLVGTIDEVGITRDVPPVLARRVARLGWTGALARLAELRALPAQPQFDVVASLDGRRNYNRYAVENAVGPALASTLGGRFLPRDPQGQRHGDPDLTVRLFVRGGDVVTALRLAARPLHRRAYKQHTAAGTLHPPLAAALALLGAPADGQADVLDPFCGDGTIAIETALRYPDYRVAGSDIDQVRVDNARHNARLAGAAVTLSVQDAGTLPDTGDVTAVLTNPPWNVAVEVRGSLARSLDQFWRRLPAVLAPSGQLAMVTDHDLDAPDRLRVLGYQLGLAARIRIAGRVSHLVLATPAGHAEPRIPPALAAWRQHALVEGVITDAGF
jgi:tRNA (guanine6-N2)-methyltransferase